MVRSILVLAAVAALALPAAAAAGTATDTAGGIELPSADISTTGNFVGLTSGDLPGIWFAQVVHNQLVYTLGQPTSITGGSFTLATTTSTLNETITGGSVTPTSLPDGCSNQTFSLSLTLSGGSFAGTLTHFRLLLFGSCITYFATVTGTATLNT